MISSYHDTVCNTKPMRITKILHQSGSLYSNSPLFNALTCRALYITAAVSRETMMRARITGVHSNIPTSPVTFTRHDRQFFENTTWKGEGGKSGVHMTAQPIAQGCTLKP